MSDPTPAAAVPGGSPADAFTADVAHDQLVTADASPAASVSHTDPKRDPAKRIVWIDCEMTGLSLHDDALVEIACIVTEADLTLVDDGISLVIKPPAQPLAAMDQVVVEMHENSGLMPLIADGVSLPEATQAVLSYVQRHVPEARRAPLAGSTIYVDRGFLARDMPELDAHLHYRVIDVSSIKELMRRWYPKIYYGTPEKTGNHRAMGDILDSIAELQYYRDTAIAPVTGGESAPTPS